MFWGHNLSSFSTKRRVENLESSAPCCCGTRSNLVVVSGPISTTTGRLCPPSAPDSSSLYSWCVLPRVPDGLHYYSLKMTNIESDAAVAVDTTSEVPDGNTDTPLLRSLTLPWRGAFLVIADGDVSAVASAGIALRRPSLWKLMFEY